MGADRPLATRYGEPVFPDKDWSPTVSQAMALIEIAKGEPIKDDLIEALVVSFPPRIRNVSKALVQPFNSASARKRHAIKEALRRVVSFNIINTPDYAETEEAQEARSNLLALAVAQVGLELMSEV